MSVVTDLKGGLGNQLFILAGSETVARQLGRSLVILNQVTPATHHSSQDYFQTIFRGWREYQTQIANSIVQITEPSYELHDWTTLVNTSLPVQPTGYFQNYRNIPDDFVSRLSLPDTKSLPGAFLHVRGGDYVGIGRHAFFIDLTAYYERAVHMFPQDTHFYIFTNDVPFAKSLPILQTIQHTFIEESDEVKTLALMSRCKVGGICANSTFSWWGAYLNPDRILAVPNKWFNHSGVYIEGYFFPGAHVLPV